MTTTQTTSPRPSSSMGSTARIFAYLTAALGVLQGVLGFTVFGRAMDADIHGWIGMATLAVSIITAIVMFLWLRGAGNKGLLWHAVAVAVLALAQVALGELHMEHLHIGLGVLFVIAAIALAPMVSRRTV